MNREMREKLQIPDAIGYPIESILTAGSKIFWQTHFYPLIKIQNSAREIYLSFNSPEGSIPVLLNVRALNINDESEIYCSGMEISNRNRYEKELLAAKKIAEDALNENEELIKIKNELLENQKSRESQYQSLKSLQEQQEEVFKLIAHDLQEPLRKSIFFSDRLLHESHELPDEVIERLLKIVHFNLQMKEMLMTLQRFEELGYSKLELREIDLEHAFNTAYQNLEFEEHFEIVVTRSFKNSAFLGDEKMLVNLFQELLRRSMKTRNRDREKLEIEISTINSQKNIFAEQTNRYKYDSFIKISYSDNGSGFSNENEKVFKIIQKSSQFNQISIGLAYCKKIVELHSGYMVAKSVRGKGVGFTIWLPLNPD